MPTSAKSTKAVITAVGTHRLTCSYRTEGGTRGSADVVSKTRVRSPIPWATMVKLDGLLQTMFSLCRTPADDVANRAPENGTKKSQVWTVQ
ncbi:hypothetical protein ERJ75_000675200 [Trypanosoma vivax]|nr:hypothetical protein ERJ75_000675200 [Trypanosoma vivax]